MPLCSLTVPKTITCPLLSTSELGLMGLHSQGTLIVYNTMEEEVFERLPNLELADLRFALADPTTTNRAEKQKQLLAAITANSAISIVTIDA
jgi:hypothetical protein